MSHGASQPRSYSLVTCIARSLRFRPPSPHVTFGNIGATMSDANPTPLALDGMSAFRGLSRACA